MIYIKSLILVLTSISAIVGLFGSTTRNNKLNKKGFIIFGLIIIGLCCSIIIEIIQVKNENENKRLEEEWNLTEKQPIFNFEFNIALRQEFNSEEFISLTKSILIKYTFSETNDIGRYKINTLKFIELDSTIQKKDRYKLANIDINEKLISKVGVYFYPYYHDLLTKKTDIKDTSKESPTLIIGADKEKDSYFVITGKSFTINDWTYSANRNIDWTKDSLKLCGLQANIPWKFINTNQKLNSIYDLSSIASITIQLPTQYVNPKKTDELSFDFQISDNQRLHCDLTDDAKNITKDGIISLSGFELYKKLKDNFILNNGRNVPPIEIR